MLALPGTAMSYLAIAELGGRAWGEVRGTNLAAPQTPKNANLGIRWFMVVRFLTGFMLRFWQAGYEPA